MHTPSTAPVFWALVWVLCGAPASVAVRAASPTSPGDGNIMMPAREGTPTPSRASGGRSPGVQSDAASRQLKQALTALSSQRYAEAYKLLEPLSKSRPTNPQIWTAKGMALAGLRQFKESLASYEKALVLQRDFLPALEGAAQVEYRTGQPGAGTTLEKVLALQPDDPTAHAMLGVLSYEHKDCGTAIAHFERSQPEISGNAPALAQYGQCLVSLGQAAKATEVFKRVVVLEPENSSARYNLGLCQVISHDNRAAISTLDASADAPASDPDVLNLLAAAYEADHQTDAAVQNLRKATELAPKDVKNYLDLAALCMDHGAYALGVEVTTTGIRNLPDSAALYTMRGILRAQFMQLEEAEQDFRRANQLEPEQAFGSMGLGITYLQKDNPDKSIQVLRDRLASTPNDATLNCLLAEALSAKGIEPGAPEFTEARQALLRSLRTKPDFARAHAQLGKLYLLSGDSKRALDECKAAADLAPNDRMAIYGLVRAMRQSGLTSEALPLLAKLRSIDAQERKAEAEKERVQLVKAVPSRAIER